MLLRAEIFTKTVFHVSKTVKECLLSSKKSPEAARAHINHFLNEEFDEKIVDNHSKDPKSRWKLLRISIHIFSKT